MENIYLAMIGIIVLIIIEEIKIVNKVMDEKRNRK